MVLSGAEYTRGLVSLFRAVHSGSASHQSGLPAGVPTNTLIGGLGSVVNGVGMAAVLDTRDNIYSPLRGWYADVSSMLYRSALGSQFAFTIHKAINCHPSAIMRLP
jgi:hypothetical protein